SGLKLIRGPGLMAPLKYESRWGRYLRIPEAVICPTIAENEAHRCLQGIDATSIRIAHASVRSSPSRWHPHNHAVYPCRRLRGHAHINFGLGISKAGLGCACSRL